MTSAQVLPVSAAPGRSCPLLNLAPGLPELAVRLRDDSPLAGSVPYRGSTAPVDVPAGSHDLELLEPQTGRPLLTVRGLTLQAGSVHTLVSAGGGGLPLGLTAVVDAAGAVTPPVGGVAAGLGGAGAGLGGPGAATRGPALVALVALSGAAGAALTAVAGGARSTRLRPARSPSWEGMSPWRGWPRPSSPPASPCWDRRACDPPTPAALHRHGPPRPVRGRLVHRGPAPGDPGPAVLAGHVDSRRGPGVFADLAALRPGHDVLVSRRDGTVLRFVVDRVEQHPKSDFPTRSVYGPVPGSELRLITCGGTFDRSDRRYRDNVVVFARLAEAAVD